MVEVHLCSAAERDYAVALEWYAKQSVALANRLDAEMDRSLQLVAENPERYPKCDSRHRFFLLQDFPYHIIYRCRPNLVEVIAIAHHSRSPEYWSGR